MHPVVGEPIARKLAKALVMALCWLAAAAGLALPVAAQGDGAQAACHAFSGYEAGPDDLTAQDRWICQEREWISGQPVSWLRFERESWSGASPPRYFVSRITRFDKISVGSTDGDGGWTWTHYAPAQVTPVPEGSLFAVPLPAVDADTQAVVVRLEMAWASPVLMEAQLSPRAGEPGWKLTDLLLLTLICGLLFAPLAFNFAFYSVLRESFVLWHAAFVAGMILHLMALSGLATLFFGAGLPVLSWLNPLSFAVAAATAAFFSSTFLEPDALDIRARRLLQAAGVWLLVTSAPLSFQPAFLHAIGQDAYYLCFVPPFFIFIGTLVQALRRGSRAARFQALAWTPFFAICLWRFLYGMGLTGSGADSEVTLFYSFASEVIVTALGVADRFMIIKRQRDHAWSKAKLLQQLSERDALTGLLNRRAIEPRFAELHADGFETLAVLDLDKFKAINDTFGHSKGDEVLKAAASALVADDDTMAMRLGGEEFMLLLRGGDAMQRAERCRQAISARVAADVEGLDRVVTASMGVVRIPLEAMPDVLFADFYARADRLL